MAKKRKVTKKDFIPIRDPIWITTENGLQPSQFFSEWWKAVAKKQGTTIVDAAIRLGYLSHDGEPIKFDYDPHQYRQSLGLPVSNPIVHIGDETQSYTTMWDKFLEAQNEEGMCLG